MIDNITYKQWTAVDRSSLETVNQHSYDFVESFCERLEALRSHSFIATQQSNFFDQCKSSLKPGELVVCADFSENYAFILQDATPLQLYQWASKSIPGVNFEYCTLEEYESKKTQLEKRFDNSRTIAGTRRLHCFIPNSRDSLQTKKYSLSSSSKVERVTKLVTDLELEQVAGYVTCKNQGHWWLAQVLAKDSDNGEVKLCLLYTSPSPRDATLSRMPSSA